MVIGTLQVDLNLPDSHSLKDKRMVLRSLKDRVRREFNVSIAEVADNDLWQSAVLVIVTVSNDRQYTNRVLSKVVDFIGQSRNLVVLDYQLSLY
jgi:uncharacterized protein YlxP (DUF503 family)